MCLSDFLFQVNKYNMFDSSVLLQLWNSHLETVSPPPSLNGFDFSGKKELAQKNKIDDTKGVLGCYGRLGFAEEED